MLETPMIIIDKHKRFNVFNVSIMYYPIIVYVLLDIRYLTGESIVGSSVTSQSIAYSNLEVTFARFILVFHFANPVIVHDQQDLLNQRWCRRFGETCHILLHFYILY
jgi:hypothetical protein